VDLHLELDPERSRSYRGSVAVELELERATRVLELHASELRVSRARVVWNDAVLRGQIRERPERETIEVRLDQRVGPGQVRLELRFAGSLRGDLRGLYFASSGKRRYAFTQLEATDARRFFPCFDEPALKARFQISVTTAASHTVISNSPAARVEKLPEGRQTVHFERTPRLSTYLLALAVGALVGSRRVRCGSTPIRVWHVPGRGHLTGFALEAARESLSRLERYFDLPYPYAKLDLVAVPDFEAGAMENAGAVFFRETLLLVDRATVTRGELKRVAEVVCHELAHMWYGDLVTMAWWNDLWLNEAFATWMAFHVVDDWQPEWKMWNDFQHYRAAALELDALESTHPIYVDVATPDEATENFDLITYEKGASVVRMIERFLGAARFRAGVRRYIRRHRESNTVAADLWNALEEASGQAVESVVRTWIERPGFPLVSVRRQRVDGSAHIRVSQERFRGAPARTRRERERRSESGSHWPLPIVARVGSQRSGKTRLVRSLVRRRSGAIALGPEPRFVYANADEGSFFRPLHAPEELARLNEHLAELEPVERMGLLGHQWALVRAGRAGLETYLDLVARCAREQDPDVLSSLVGPLGFLDRHVASGDSQAELRRRLIQAFGPELERLHRPTGRKPARPETDAVRMRRAALVALLGGIADWEPVLESATRQCRTYLRRRRSLDPNLADSVVGLAARTGDAALFGDLLAARETATTPQERRRFLMGLGEFATPRLVDRALALTLTDRIATQDVALLLARMLTNPAAGERTWAFLKGRWPKLRKRMTPALVTRVVDATPALATPAYRRDVAAFFRSHPVPTGQRALRQALERFDRNAELRRRAAPELRDWLA
jgi:puromycin-sensitive aminopeptidase